MVGPNLFGLLWVAFIFQILVLILFSVIHKEYDQVERSLESGEKDYNSVRDKESRAMCFVVVENRLENGVKSYLFEPQFNNQ